MNASLPEPVNPQAHRIIPLDQPLTLALELLQGLVFIPSFSKEESVAAGFVFDWLEKQGAQPQRYLNNVWAVAPGYEAARPTLLLNSHIDTVKPVADWTRDPFTPAVIDGKFYGLGSNDAGGCVATLAATFLQLSQQNLGYNLVLALTAEEEISGMNGIEALWPHLPPIDFAIVGEPTNCQMALAERGLLVLDCTAHGQAGHAARLEGINAIYEALPDMEWFRTHQLDRVGDYLGPVTMQVTQVSAGTQHNAVPASCHFVVDIRLNECYTHQEILEIVTDNVRCQVKPRSQRLKPSWLPPTHPVAQAGAAMGLTGYGSPTLSDRALIPCASLKIGPGESRRSHTADEFIFVDELAQGIDTYGGLLRAIKPEFLR